MQKNLRLLLISVLLMTLQTTIVTFTSIGNIVPDILLIWIVYIAVTEGQMKSTVIGFLIGLTMDLVSGQFLGLSALTKTIAGFLAGYFYHENKIEITLGNYQFMVIVAVASLVHNVIYFVIFTQGSDVGLVTAIVEFGLFSTIYTTIVAMIPMFIYSRKHQMW
jgi:rod shape-determining protein MreD